MQKVLLVHGYNKNDKDMKPLQKMLNQMGYQAVCLKVPLTFADIDKAYLEFEKQARKYFEIKKENETIHFVGHSTGGLLIRYMLQDERYIPHVGRCVLIATPNKGTELADLALRYGSLIFRWFRTLEALKTTRSFQDTKNLQNIDIGAIAGKKNRLLLGKFIKGASDGRVRTESVYYEGLRDFIVLNYGHKEIHHQLETAQYTAQFLKKGSFLK